MLYRTTKNENVLIIVCQSECWSVPSKGDDRENVSALLYRVLNLNHDGSANTSGSREYPMHQCVGGDHQDHSAGPARVFHPKRAVVCTDANSSTSFYESAVTQFVWMLPRFFVQFK